MNASVRLLPGLRCAYPGYGSTAVCGPVARVRRLRRNRECTVINTSVRLLPGSRCAYPGYGSTAVCGPVARVRRLRRNPGMRRDKYIGAASSPAALRLPGLRVLTSDSQPRSNPGLFIIALFGFPGGATGQLQIGSLGCSGMNASVRLLPGSRCAYPGYGSTAVCGPVARVRRLRRNRECTGINTSMRLLPGLRCAYPGQESTAVCGPVARTGAARRLRENPAQLIFARHLRALKAAQLA